MLRPYVPVLRVMSDSVFPVLVQCGCCSLSKHGAKHAAGGTSKLQIINVSQQPELTLETDTYYENNSDLMMIS